MNTQNTVRLNSKTLWPFQVTGASFLASNPHALLADEPGLGKTVQAIAAARLVGAQKILVVCPASVRLNWRQEITECLGTDRGWNVVSYDGVRIGVVNDKERFDAVILDECHFLKSPDSQRTQAVFGNKRGVARRAHYKWCLSGTPVLNRPVELYPVLKTLASHAIAPYDSWNQYTQRYCGAFFDGRGLNVRGASRIEELANGLRRSGFMLRRTKTEVMPDLPGRVLARLPLEVPPRALLALDEFERSLGDREAFISSVRERFSAMGDCATLLRLTGEAKLRPAASFVADLLETQDKVVVYAHHHSVMAGLMAEFSARGFGAVAYAGGMSDYDKAAAVHRFVTDANVRIFLGSVTASGVGINGLQKVACSAVFAEIPWTPGVVGQALDRLHRIGQTADCVTGYLLYIPETMEGAILRVHDAKTGVVGKLMGDVL